MWSVAQVSDQASSGNGGHVDESGIAELLIDDCGFHSMFVE
jgi:hypothetical protein